MGEELEALSSRVGGSGCHHVVSHGVLPEVGEVHLGQIIRQGVKVCKDLRDVLDIEESARLRVVRSVSALHATKVQRAFVEEELPARLVGTNVSDDIDVEKVSGASYRDGAAVRAAGRRLVGLLRLERLCPRTALGCGGARADRAAKLARAATDDPGDAARDRCHGVVARVPPIPAQ